jgi:hypothetical protein
MNTAKRRKSFMGQRTLESLRDMSPVVRGNAAFQFDREWISLAITRLAGRHFNPAFADAVFLHVRSLDIVKSNADFVFKHSSNVMWTAWID